jgi:hypothetical protein
MAASSASKIALAVRGKRREAWVLAADLRVLGGRELARDAT